MHALHALQENHTLNSITTPDDGVAVGHACGPEGHAQGCTLDIAGGAMMVPEYSFRDDGETEYLENFAVHTMAASEDDLASLPAPSLSQVTSLRRSSNAPHLWAIALNSWGTHLESTENHFDYFYVLGRDCPSMTQPETLHYLHVAVGAEGCIDWVTNSCTS